MHLHKWLCKCKSVFDVLSSQNVNLNRNCCHQETRWTWKLSLNYRIVTQPVRMSRPSIKEHLPVCCLCTEFRGGQVPSSSSSSLPLSVACHAQMNLRGRLRSGVPFRPGWSIELFGINKSLPRQIWDVGVITVNRSGITKQTFGLKRPTFCI